MLVSADDLKRFCSDAFMCAGMKEEYSDLCADVLMTADAMGFYSHGTVNVSGYISKAKAGGVDFEAEPMVVLDSAAIAQIDAKNALGMIPSVMAMRLACDKAEEVGLAFVSVKNSSHFGAAGYYVNMAAERGCIGFATSNVDANMAVPGSLGKAIGNNPIAFAAPASSIPSVFLDISLSATASLRVLEMKENGDAVPDGWLVDKWGMPTNDPSRYPEEGALQPMGQHKGYGLSVMVECLTGILTGCGTSADGTVPSWCFSPEAPNNVSHAFIAVDVKRFCSEGDYAARVERFMSDMHGTPTAVGSNPVRVPGERSWAQFASSSIDGIELPESTIKSLRKAAALTGLSLEERLGVASDA